MTTTAQQSDHTHLKTPLPSTSSRLAEVLNRIVETSTTDFTTEHAVSCQYDQENEILWIVKKGGETTLEATPYKRENNHFKKISESTTLAADDFNEALTFGTYSGKPAILVLKGIDTLSLFSDGSRTEVSLAQSARANMGIGFMTRTYMIDGIFAADGKCYRIKEHEFSGGLSLVSTPESSARAVNHTFTAFSFNGPLIP